MKILDKLAAHPVFLCLSGFALGAVVFLQHHPLPL
jgi:hypothetical protein